MLTINIKKWGTKKKWIENTSKRPEIPYVCSGIFMVTLNTACIWIKLSAKKKYFPLPRLLLLRQRPSSGVWNTEEKGARKGHSEQEAKPSLLVLILWPAIISSSIYALCYPLSVAS